MTRRRYASYSFRAAVAVTALVPVLTPHVVLAQDEGKKEPAKPVSFINDVAPILKENCFACHDSRKKSGKYDMTSYEKIRAGGANGDPLVPGKPEMSEFHELLVTAEPRRMPPRDKGEAVPRAKAAVIERWIKDGAKLDPGLDPKADLVKELRVRWQPPVPPKTYPFPVVVSALAFTPDNEHLVVGGHHELTVWECRTGKLVKRVRTRAERAYGAEFLPDGKLVVAGGRPGQEGDVRVYNILDNESKAEDGVAVLDGVNDKAVLVKHLFDVEDAVLCLAVTPDGKTLAAGGCDRAVRVFDLSGGLDKAKLTQTVENHADWVLGCALSADGKYLLTAGRDKTAKVWDIQAKESVVTFPEHQNIVYGVAVKADGSAGFSVGADKQLRTWKPSGEGKQVKNAGGHGEDVFKIVVNPKQPLLATASADKTVRLWTLDLAPGKTLSGLTDYVYAVAFSPDGERVAAGSYDGTVAVWNVKDGTLVKLFNASPGIATKEPEPKKK
jgi:WD40 repeat protein